MDGCVDIEMCIYYKLMEPNHQLCIVFDMTHNDHMMRIIDMSNLLCDSMCPNSVVVIKTVNRVISFCF